MNNQNNQKEIIGYAIVYDVRNDSEEKLEQHDNANYEHNEHNDYSFYIAIFKTKEEAEIYMQELQDIKDYSDKTSQDTFDSFMVYNADACTIQEIYADTLDEKLELDFAEAKRQIEQQKKIHMKRINIRK